MTEMVDAKAYRWANQRIRELEAALEAIRDHKETCTAGVTRPQPCLRAVELIAQDALNPEQDK